MKTEEEARKCWCPFARWGTGHDANSGNRHGDEWGHVFCIASECMAWRWEKTWIERQNLEVGEQPEPDAKIKGWETPTTTLFGKVVWERKHDPLNGYCGLAGKP